MAVDGPDPYQALVAQARGDRAAITARANAPTEELDKLRARLRTAAVNHCLEDIAQFATKAAKFVDPQDPDELVQCALDKRLRWHAVRVYNGTTEAPDDWHRMVRAIIGNTARDLWRDQRRDRKHASSLEAFEQQPDDPSRHATYQHHPDDVDDLAIANVNRSGYLRAVRIAMDAVAVLRAGDPDPYRCAFHPGQPCRHATSGRKPIRCHHRPVILASLHDALSSEHLEAPALVRQRLAGLTTHVERVGVRCLDWFAYLLLRVPSSAPAAPTMVAAMSERMRGTGSAKPSAATVCLIMNNHPDIRIPEDLECAYAPVHRDGDPT